MSEFDVHCPDQWHAWCLKPNMYYLFTPFAICCKWSENSDQPFFHPIIIPTIIVLKIFFYRTFPSTQHRFQNKSPIGIFPVDMDIWQVNWAMACNFNGASPTRSLQWGMHLKHQLASEWFHCCMQKVVMGWSTNKRQYKQNSADMDY